jgi:hypothetical protein
VRPARRWNPKGNPETRSQPQLTIQAPRGTPIADENLPRTGDGSENPLTRSEMGDDLQVLTLPPPPTTSLIWRETQPLGIGPSRPPMHRRYCNIKGAVASLGYLGQISYSTHAVPLLNTARKFQGCVNAR